MVISIHRKIKIVFLVIMYVFLCEGLFGQSPTTLSDLLFFVESTEIDTSLHVANCNTDFCLNHSNSEQAPINEQYCDTGSCADGCVRRWQDQSGYVPSGGFNPPEYTMGRNFGQDDSEKPCYIPNGINGKPSVKGGPAYGSFSQDKYLELEVADILSLPQDFSIFLLCKPEDQSATGDWFYFGQAAHFVRHRISSNTMQLRINPNPVVSVTTPGAIAMGEWQLVEIHRDASNNLTSYVNGVETSVVGANSSGTMRIGYLLSNFKTGASNGTVSMHGEVASMAVYNRELAATEKDQVREYLSTEFCLGLCVGTKEFSSGTWVGGAPTLGTTAIISSDYNTATDGGSLEACEITVQNGATLTISGNDYLKVHGDITVQSGSSLVVEHQGNVVQIDNDATVTNNGTIEVKLTTPLLHPRDFMVMGSPMTLETRNDVFADAFLVLNFNPEDFLPHPDVPSGGTNFADDNGDFYAEYNGVINPGEGYIVRPQSGYTDPAITTYDMTYSLGTLNNGQITYTATSNGATANPNGTPNVAANPYASAVDGDLFMTTNGINALYFWEHLTPPGQGLPVSNMRFDMDDISIRNLGMGIPAANDIGGANGTAPNGVLSTGQGFGFRVHGTAGSTQPITFTNDMRLTSGNTTLRQPMLSPAQFLRLEVRSYSNGLGAFTGIGFQGNATQGMDYGYDTQRLATIVSLFSHLPDGSEQLGIQTLGIFDPEIKVPLGFSTQIVEEDAYVIQLLDREGEQLENIGVFLFDSETEITTNLTHEPYRFESGKTQDPNRFLLFFESETLSLNDLSMLDAITLFPNPTYDRITVVSNTPETIKNIEVRNIAGQKVLETSRITSKEYLLDLSHLKPAVYFVIIETETSQRIKRVLKMD